MKEFGPKENSIIIYKGGCDTVRSAVNYKWGTFVENELVVGKEYRVVGGFCAQRSYILNDDKTQMIPDDSGERYFYACVENELGENIFVWTAFFEEKVHD